jgi:hypothetical protein
MVILSVESLSEIKVEPSYKGQQIATLGDASVTDYATHLHFQIISELLSASGEFVPMRV